MSASNVMASTPAYQSVLAGAVRVCSSEPALVQRLQEDTLACIRVISGETVSEAVRGDGLKRLHHHVPLEDIPKITQKFYTDPGMERDTWRMLRSAGRQELGIAEPFHVLREVFLRIMPPFSAYRDRPGYHARRRDAEALKYQFISHAPHRDSWAGDAEELINIWMALDEVPAAAGITVFPKQFGIDVPHIPVEPFYMTREANVPGSPEVFNLSPGKYVAFASDQLHGTRLNTTELTRVAVTGRISPTPPRYRPEFAATNRDQWLRSSDVDAPDLAFLDIHEAAQRAGQACRPSAPREPVQVRAASYTGWNLVCSLEDIPRDQGLAVRIGDRELAVFRTGGEAVALDNVCPHLYYRLANGPQVDGAVICPGHCLSFDLRTGRCRDDATFAVAKHQVRCDGSNVFVKLG